MMMKPRKKSEMPGSSIVYSCRGREGGDWVNNCSKQPSWSFYEEQDSNDDDDGAGADADDSGWLWTFTIKDHNI